MRISRRYRRWSLVPAAFWVLIQSMMLSASIGVAAANSEDGAARSIVICTAQGFKTIQVSDDTEQPAEIEIAECPWCQAFGSLPVLSSPDTVLYLEREPDRNRRVLAHAVRDAVQVALTGYSSRAPPTPLKT